MAVRAIGHELDAELLELVLKRFGVGDNLFLIGDKFRLDSLLQRNSESGDGVVVWPALVTWEDRKVDWAFEIVEKFLAGLGVGLADALAVEDHGATRPAEGFMGCGCDDVGVFEGGGNHAGRDQARDVRHVDHEVGAAEIGDLAHAFVVDEAAVGGRAGHKDFGAVHEGIFLEGLVVDDPGFEVDSVGKGFEIGGDSRYLLQRGLIAVTQVAAVGEIEAHQSLMWPHDRLIDLEIRRTAAQSLDVNSPFLRVELECLEGSGLARQFNHVDKLVASIVTCSWIAL